MTTVILSISTTPTALPTGTTFSGYMFTLTDGKTPVTQTTTALTSSFASVAPGSYTASAQAIDHAGAVFGPVVSVTLTVPVPAPTTFEAPAVLSFTLS